ncbi:endonuclease/exonuclease/phosphatase family protein [Flavobacterium sp. ANB]|uniref:endonuclease/exonuclease/phosphatase family protein n=1 Tax=unclassified Flavobacterium TaxID=196869 RepID=UPI0012B76F4B|nr:MULTISPECIES: endonuclease/exonuclease/phosphatase family protein [unclassified Flavobacterium]MBF4515135.1 endonuclease/exonuclease/phosphatase family protein [Flavobacterium sp. ANB]MTD70047.1 endonuclease/exonuclease/phosphatase family protein [Flavobacterium sp. LC2016-13]
MRFVIFWFYLFTFFSFSLQAQSKKYIIHTVAFYNFENLFDTKDDLNTNDDEWTPNGAQHWTEEKYQQKLQNLSRVLSETGTPENSNAPVIIGGSEIENRGVLEDLIKQTKLLPYDYGIIHFDSPDKRGIDVALLYQKKYFRPTSFSNIPLLIYKNNATIKEEKPEETDDDLEVKIENKNRVFTRDQLLVSGYLEGEEIHIIVNHWPSRSGGEKASSPFREAAGRLNRKIIDSLQQINPNAKVMTMGDLNDGPFNKSVKTALGAKSKKNEVPEFGVFNPFEEMANKGMGTIAFRDSWDIFDQIIITESFIKPDFSSFKFWKASIFNKPYLVQTFGQYKGYPLRHSQTEVGFSDHFPVYIYLIKEMK